MSSIDKILGVMRKRPQSVSFEDAKKICKEYFGEPRQEGTSHVVYKMPWPGDPRVNLQKGKNGMAKAYQVRQLVKAIDKLEKGDTSDQEG